MNLRCGLNLKLFPKRSVFCITRDNTCLTLSKHSNFSHYSSHMEILYRTKHSEFAFLGASVDLYWEQINLPLVMEELTEIMGLTVPNLNFTACHVLWEEKDPVHAYGRAFGLARNMCVWICTQLTWGSLPWKWFRIQWLPPRYEDTWCWCNSEKPSAHPRSIDDCRGP